MNEGGGLRSRFFKSRPRLNDGSVSLPGKLLAVKSKRATIPLVLFVTLKTSKEIGRLPRSEPGGLDYIQPLIDLVKDSPWTQRAITAGVPAVLAYLLGRKHKRAELNKVRAEAETHRLGHLRQLDEIDKAFREADRHLVDAARSFFQAHDLGLNDKPQFEKAREELCAAFADILSQKANNFRCHCHVDRDDPHHLQTLIDATVSDLRLWRKYLLAINNPAVLEYLSRRPLPVRRYTLQPIRDACQGLRIDPNALDALHRAIDDVVSDDE